jgi:cytochrome c peroxidase
MLVSWKPARKVTMGTKLAAPCLGAMLLLACGAAGPALPAPSPDEAAHIVAHGPWPPPAAQDPSNRVSGNAAAISFGRRMFHEPRFSINGYVACVTCHQTDRAYTDGIARARGLAPVERNTPTVLNAAFSRRWGWAGNSDSLWMASLRPLRDAREMASSAAQVARVVRIGDGLACEYRRAFGRSPAHLDDETVMVDVAKALAAFQETLVTGRTAFDDFRDALAKTPGAEAGPALLATGYPAAAWRGALLFVGRGACAACHAGASFTDGSLRAVAATTASVEPPGRIRVPGLRNVAVTAPYRHDGSLDTLQQAVRHADGARIDDGEVDDLVAFLNTLTDAEGAKRAVQRPGDSTCR